MSLLRSIRSEDKDIIYKWRNDFEIISKGTTQRGVSKEEHAIWFKESLVGEKRKIFIIQLKKTSIGQIRFDKSNTKSNECFVSIYLFSNKKNGIGTKCLKEGIEIICQEWPSLQIVNAIVLKYNLASINFFKKNGFLVKKEKDDQIKFIFKIK